VLFVVDELVELRGSWALIVEGRREEGREGRGRVEEGWEGRQRSKLVGRGGRRKETRDKVQVGEGRKGERRQLPGTRSDFFFLVGSRWSVVKPFRKKQSQ
jgi:hypothetical protein